MAVGESVVSTLIAKLILDTTDFVKNSGGATKKLASVAAGLTGIGSTATKVAKNSVTAAMEFETAFTGVMKTVEAPEGSDAGEFFSGLRKEILEMSSELPSTATEIAGVYQAAGQLGIEAENLTGFSRAMIQLASATNLSSEEAATGLAQFANVMGTDQTLFENMGSSIVALGNNFATNEAQIVSFAQEMAIAGKLAGLSEADVLGFGTAMASMGLDAASSGTAFQRFTQTLTSEVASWDSAAGEGSNSLKQIAETAGMTSEQFVEAWGTDATGAIQAFLSGLGEMDVSDQLDMFKDLEIGQQQEITMLQSLASNTDLVTDAIDMSNKAWEENTALSAEAGAANVTTAAQLAMTRNRVTELAINIGETLLPIIRDILEFLSPIIEKIAKFASEHPKLTKGLVLLGIALGIIGGLLSTLLPFITMLSGASGIAAVGAALGGLIAPAMPVIAVIGLIIAGFLLLKTAIENNFLGLGDRFEELKQKLSPVVEAVKGYFNDLKDTFENGGLEAVLVKLGQDAAQLVTDAIASVFDLVGDIGNTALGMIQDAWTNISAEIESWSFVQAIKGKWEELTSAFDTGGILGVLTQLKNDIVGAFEGLWEGSPIKTAIDTVTNGIQSAFQWLYDILVGHSIVPELIDAVVNCFSGWWDRIKGFVEDVVNGVVDFFKDIGPKLSEYLNALDISEALSNFIQGIGKSVKGFWETHVKGAFTGSDGLAGRIGNWIGEIDLLEAARGLVDKIKTGISGAWDSFKEWFKGLFKGLFDSIEIPDWLNPKKWFGGGKKEEKGQTKETGSEGETIEMPEGMKLLDYDNLQPIPDNVIASYGALRDALVEINAAVESLNELIVSEAFQGLTKTPIDAAVTDAWTNFGNAVSQTSDGFSSLRGMLSIGEEEGAGLSNFSDMFTPISDDTIKSYQALATALRDIYAALNGESEEGAGTEGAENAAANGLGANTGLPGQSKGKGQSPGASAEPGAEGMGEAEGGLKGLIGAFDKVYQRMEGVRTKAQELAECFGQDLMPAIGQLQNALCIISTDEEGNTDASGGNTLYNSLGAIQGVIGDTLSESMRLAQFWATTFLGVLSLLKEKCGPATGKIAGLGSAAAIAAEQFHEMAAAIWEVVAALAALNGAGGGGTGGVGGNGIIAGAAAEGGPVRRNNTYLVGEKGPELFTPRQSGYIIPNDDLRGGSRDDRPEIHVEINGNIYGEKYLKDYVVDTLTGTIRKELRLAA